MNILTGITLGLGLFASLVLLILVGPFLVIWSLNTLFPLVIPYTFKTWMAALLLSWYFGKASVSINKS